MAASPLCCFFLEATRGPHSGVVLRHCHVEAASASSSSSPSLALSIGRKKRCWLRLPKDLEVSSVHAEFRFVERGTRVAIRDSKSTNGTKLNAKALTPHEDYPLSNGDLIAVGKTSLRFLQVVHNQQCGEERENSAIKLSGAAILTSSVSSSVAQSAVIPGVIVLDEDSAQSAEGKEAPLSSVSASVSTSKDVSIANGLSGNPADQPDTEPAHDELVLVKPMKNVVASKSKSRKEGTDAVAHNPGPAIEAKHRTGVVNENTPEEATCTVCKVMIGQLDLLEQQAHRNACLGGRTMSTTVKSVEPKTRKRGNAGGGAIRSKKPRKPKAGENDDDAAAVSPKAKKPRKRKRADAGESIELAMALTGKTKMSKEEQTDMQLVVTKKKLGQLDDQIAKLTKRRVNLVKTLDRLERTKEKLRKSQVLPPAKVLQLLDMKAALNAIFPSNRQAYPADRRAGKELGEFSSVVATQYTPSRWSGSELAMDCDEEKRAELAVVAAISMWARASQQVFGLPRDTLLYRNSVLRTFIGDDEDPDSSIMDVDNVGDGDDEDGEGDIDYEREEEPEEISEIKPIPLDDQAGPHHAEVPDVVKCVFPNWQRDLAFLRDQTAEELDMALEAMNEALAQADAVTIAESESGQREGVHTMAYEGDSAAEVEIATLNRARSAREEQRLACAYMAQVMMQLIAEKKHHTRAAKPAEEMQQQSVIDLVDSSGEEVRQQVQASDMVVASGKEAEEKPDNFAFEELPKPVTGCS